MSKIAATKRNSIRLFSFGQYLISFVSIEKRQPLLQPVEKKVDGSELPLLYSRIVSAHILNVAIATTVFDKTPGIKIQSKVSSRIEWNFVDI